MKQSYKSETCFHCELPIPKGFDKTLQVSGEERAFCCEGCLAVADMIVQNSLEDYYKFRTESGEKPDAIVDLENELKAFDQADVQQEFIVSQTDNNNNILLYADQIRCSACAWLLERTLSRLQGVSSIQVNVSAQVISLSWNPESIKLSRILKQAHKMGYSATPYKQEEVLLKQKHIQKQWLKRLGLAGLGMMQVMMFAVALYLGAFSGMSSDFQWLMRSVSFLVSTPVLLYSGYPFYSSAFAVLKNRQLNMDVPITLALIVAYSASMWAFFTHSGEVYFDSVTMFIFFLLIGRYIEFRVRQRVSERVYKGNVNKINYAEKYEPDTDSYRAITTTLVQEGDLLLVRAGKQVAVDGTLVSDTAELDVSMLNGEFMPSTLSKGQQVLAGSINHHQPFMMQATASDKGSYWDKLLQLQEAALLDKPKIALLADQIARYFVLAILCIASLVAAYWISVGSDDALWITLSVLVVSCPCALSLATPVAMTCSILSFNKNNILIKGQDFLQSTNEVTDIVFDKTGTLTLGKLSVDTIEVYSEQSKDTVLALIAALEHRSEHPIAKAFAKYHSPDVEMDSVNFLPFKGVEGSRAGKSYYFGNSQNAASQQLLEQCGDDADALYLTEDSKVIARVTLSDTLREEAAEVCQNLSNKGYTLHLLSGDPSSQVQNLAEKIGFEHWQNDVKPEDKLDYIQKLQDQQKKVLVVGDGVNDAPIMAAANASVAMAAAADITRTSADCYLMADNLRNVEFALTRSKKTQSVIKQNLAWSLGYNFSMIPLAAMGYIPPYIAAIGMSLSSVVVVINSLRLKE
ncbi:MAG: ATPase P [Rickettsiales bacterium]|nr:ATPase P [Rickettsiales bacterium]